jgi:hypothetical protein
MVFEVSRLNMLTTMNENYFYYFVCFALYLVMGTFTSNNFRLIKIN